MLIYIMLQLPWNLWLLNSKQDIVGGGLFIPKPELQKLAIDGDLTMSRRGSALVSAPSLISLHDKTMDILAFGGATEEEKDEEKKDS